ncbi:MAG: GTPase Era, partial [Myxococcales bacterium]|nr:GTPase Era [Myxococcales bacterium]
MDDATPQAGHRCGFVTLIGKPNVGKSTLLNQLLGEKLAITSNRPQTTRNRIPGVLTRPDAQLVFIDTPGVHRAKRALNQYMVDVATEAMWETDAVVLLVEAGVGDDLQVGISDIALELLAQLKERSKPVFLVINKIDRIEKPNLLPIIAAYSALHDFEAVVPLSALRGENVDGLVDALVRVLPEGPALYPADALTDLPERFIAAELIREKLFRNLGQEVPYSTA